METDETTTNLVAHMLKRERKMGMRRRDKRKEKVDAILWMVFGIAVILFIAKTWQ